MLAYSTVGRPLLALAAAALGAGVLVAEGSAGSRTTSQPDVVSVRITITDTAISMSPRIAQRGAMAHFTLVNKGKKPHTFTFGRGKPGSGSQAGFVRTLKPREQSMLSLFLDYRGTIQWAGTAPADRGNPRMKGTFRIT